MPLGLARLAYLAKAASAATPSYRPVTVTSIGSSGVGSGFTVNTAQSQFGGASAYSTGSNKLLSFSDIPLGSGDWTIEFWFRADSTSGTRTIIDFRDPGGSDTQSKPTIYLSGTKIYYYVDGAIRAQSSYYNAGALTWYHAAVVKYNGVVTVYFRGYWNNAISQYNDSYDFGVIPGVIGVKASSLDPSLTMPPYPTDDYAGYIDEVRISSIARYTSTFLGNEPTSAFVNDADTLMLLHMDGSNGSTVFTDDNS